MRFRHDEASVAYACATVREDASVYDRLFTYDIVIAYEAICLLAFPAEVLWIGADDCALVHLVVAPHAGAFDNACIRHDLTSVSNLDVGVDVCEWVDGYILADNG